MTAFVRQAAVAVGLAAVLLVGGAGVAQADDELEVQVAGGGPLFDLDRLAPGATGGTEATATNNAADDAVLSARAVDVVDDDNGCVDAEVELGDDTCGVGGGDLGQDLILTIAVDGDERYEGSLLDLAAGDVDLGAVAAGQTVDLDFGYEFDVASGNETQTDRVSFEIELALTQDVDTAVAGVQLTSGPRTIAAQRVAGAVLARTGTDLVGLMRLGATAAAAGCALLLVVDRRRRLVPVAAVADRR